MILSVFDDYKTKRKNTIRLFLFMIVLWLLLTKIVFNLFLINSNIKITAHRGSKIFSPENTISSVIEAITLNSDYIEIDVQLTKDNKVILLHDRTFSRVGGIDVKPQDLTYEEICKINVGAYKSSIPFINAPLLEEVIDICKLSNSKLIIELKDYEKDNLPLEVVKILREKDYISNCYVQSFSLEMVMIVKEEEPSIKVGLLTYSPSLITYTSNSFLDFYSINYLSITPQIEKYLKSKNKEIFCYTPSSEFELAMALKTGATNIITNNVELAKIQILLNR